MEVNKDKEGSVDKWNSREHLYLASCVLTHGDNNWAVVSDVMKSFVNTKLRSLEWYSPEKCSAQFAWMLKDFEKNETTTDGKESRLKLLENYWKEKRHKEVTEESDKIVSVIGQLENDLEILKSGALDDHLWILVEELRKRKDPFWQQYGEKFMESVSASSKSEEIMARGKAPILETTEVQKNVIQYSGIALPSKEAQNSSPHSSRKIESSPKAFFNPNNLLTNSAAGFFTLSSAAPSQSTTTTTTVSSVTLSAPTLSKLLEMPPSFAGKLPPLPVTQRTKGVMPVSQEKNNQKVVLKSVAVPPTSGHSESNIGKFVAINVSDNLKMEAKHILIKPSDVNSFLSKTSEHAQLIVQESAQIPAQSGETILAPTLQTDSNKIVELEKVSDNLTKIMPVSENLGSQEETITYFKPKEQSQNITNSSPMKNITAEPKEAVPIGKLKETVVSPIPQKLTPTKSPVKALESSKCDENLDIVNPPLPSKTVNSPTKVTKKSHLSPHPGSTSLQQTLDTSVPGSDPFTFDEAAEKFSDKIFSRGIKRKRDSTVDAGVVQSPTASGVATEKVQKQIDSLSVVSPLEVTGSNNVMNSDISRLSAVDTSNTDISSTSCKVPHVEEIADKNEPDKKKFKKDVLDVKNENQEIVLNSAPIKEVVTVVKTQTDSNNDTSPQVSSCVDEKSQVVFDEMIENHLKSDIENNAELGKISSNASLLESFPEQTSPDAKISKQEINEKNGVYDFPSDEKNPDVIVKSRYSASSKGRRGRPRALDKNAKVQEQLQVHDESNKEKSTFIKTEKSMRKSTESSSSIDMVEDDSTTSSQDSDKEFLAQSNVNKKTEDHCKSDAEDVFEKRSSELSDVGCGLSKNISTIAKDANVDDSVSTPLKSTSVSTPAVRGKESKTHWSPQSVDPASQCSLVTPTTSDSDDSDNFVMSDDSTNPDSKQSKFKWADRKSEKKYKAWKKSIGIVWSGAANHRYANVFAQRVTDDVAPGYHNVVFRPMDLATIKRNIDNGAIKTTEEFQRDVMLMFQNAIMYNSSDHDVYKMAVEMQGDVFMQIQDLANRLSMQDENIKGPTVGISRNVRQSKVVKSS